MKKTILALFTLAFCLNASAQEDNIKPSSIGVNFSLFDFQTAANIRNSSLGEAFRHREFARLKNMKSAFGVTYEKGITKNLDFAGTVSAAYLRYPVPNKAASLSDKLLLEATAVANVKLLPDNFCVVPYITAGFGLGKDFTIPNP